MARTQGSGGGAGRSSGRLSNKPSEAQQGGGNFGWPVGSIVTVTEFCATTWDDAGESALKGGRNADDPCIKVVGEIEGQDAPATEYFGNGKGRGENGRQPTSDGEFFEPTSDDSTVEAGISGGSNTDHFLKSIFGDPAGKTELDRKPHGKHTPDEEMLNDGFSALVGLVFRVGKKVVDRPGLTGKSRPISIVEEIIELPGKGSKKAKKAAEDEDEPRGRGRGRGRGRDSNDDEDEPDAGQDRGRQGREADEDEDEDEDTSSSRARRPKAAGGRQREDGAQSDDSDAGAESSADAAAEKAILDALTLPKYREGIPVDAAFVAVHRQIKSQPGKVREKIQDLAQDLNWLMSNKRPWKVEEKTVDGEVVDIIVEA